ncbi:2-nitropropane dioxygenase [Hyphodiscus hymeniophilus]|uniref:2-nitropropane dioxygenase n=1 Tax=Hyphodiscus hymeniophilus TaxID=353542 RepID=A0A9P6SQ11_9HELO|nr:2-nitropropane dioxygenase [Hyphodiscus hymeniophilus]
MASHAESLKSQYPWTSKPFIVSAPLRAIAGPALATSVSRASGLGFLGAGTDLSNFEQMFSECINILQKSPIPNSLPGIVPIGVGFICWGASLPVALSVITKANLKPAAAWLFAPKEAKDLMEWAQGIRKASNGKTRIWVQVGTVAMAIEIVRSCEPDVLVIQGSDAGGHGLAKSSSIISLLPECADALQREGFGHIPLVAAGGVMDGRGVVAAIALGATGICMGTRFLSTPEAVVSKGYQYAVIRAKDGGVSTARTRLYDSLRGTPGWPEDYNGRGVLNHSFWDHEKGMGEKENTRLYEKAVETGDAGWGDQGRMTTYAGTGVGLIHKVQPAAEIVAEVLREAKKYLTGAQSRL